MEASTISHTPFTIQEKYNATITKFLPLKNPETGAYESEILQLNSNTNHRVAFLLNTSEIHFSSPNGSRTFWVEKGGIIHIDKRPILLVQEQKNYTSFGFYGLDGTMAPLHLRSQLGTIESICRVLIDSVDGIERHGTIHTKLMSILPINPIGKA